MAQINYFAFAKGILASIIVGILWSIFGRALLIGFFGWYGYILYYLLISWFIFPVLIGWRSRDSSKTIVFTYIFYLSALSRDYLLSEYVDWGSIFLYFFGFALIAFVVGGVAGMSFESRIQRVSTPRRRIIHRPIETHHYFVKARQSYPHSMDKFENETYEAKGTLERSITGLRIASFFIFSISFLSLAIYLIAIAMRIEIKGTELITIILAAESIILALYSMIQREKKDGRA